ncbi:MAG: hypothetical protein MUO35_00645 [Anaerolineales bacterium]|nr:hypothetical protein [Anaerolineales bacterium]
MQPNLQKPAPTPSDKGGGISRLLVFSWGLGMMTGLVTAAVAVMGAIALGYIALGTPAGAAPAAVLTSATPVGLGLTGTPAATLSTVEASPATLTPSPTTAVLTSTPVPPTANFAATATQACATFRSRFPGTPCPQ